MNQTVIFKIVPIYIKVIIDTVIYDRFARLCATIWNIQPLIGQRHYTMNKMREPANPTERFGWIQFVDIWSSADDIRFVK